MHISDRITFQASLSAEDALDRAAEAYGIESEYWDIFGRQHVTEPEVKRTILSSLGIDASSRESLDAAAEERLWSEWGKVLPEVIVAGGDRQVTVSIRVGHQDASALCRVYLEGGGQREETISLAAAESGPAANIRGEDFIKKRFGLPGWVPDGYHSLEFLVNGASAQALLIVSPGKAFIPSAIETGGSAAGVGLSLYGVRSGRNWGCGDFTDLVSVIDWVSEEADAGFVALNPLHALANRQPYNTSPYLPNCAFYRNPIYLDVEAVEDFRKAPQLGCLVRLPRIQEEIGQLRAAEHVEYERVYALKLRFLRIVFRNFLREIDAGTERAHRFLDWAEGEGELLDRFATYCALDEWIHKRDPDVWIWRQWPAEYQDSQSAAVREFKSRHWKRTLFHKYLQWLVDEQLAQCERRAKEKRLAIGLYHDLALATDKCGSDLWAHRDFYVEGCRVGSPPDAFSPKGQDWGFPPPNSWKHRETGYSLFIESIRKNCRRGGALRIDHVMRFFRLYWIPDGMDASQGTYVREFWKDLLRILALESVRNNVMLIGEDLGTVEPSFREALAEHRILSYRLLYFEKKDDRFISPDKYPRQALVSATTHDLPTLAGFWTGQDIEARRRANLLTDDENYRQQLEQRREEKQKLLDELIRLKLLPDWFPRSASDIPELTGELHNAIVGFLASTPSELMVLNQEDILKDVEQQNLPGSTAEYPNWRHKMMYSIEELRTEPLAQDCTRMFRTWLEKCGRANSSAN